MSVYFAGPKVGGNLFAPKAATPPAKTITVRAHTRAAPAKRAKPAAAPAAPAARPVSINTQAVRPAQVSTVQRSTPHYKGEPIAGWTGNPRNPTLRKPYYTDAYTAHYHHGPTGQAATAWNAAQVARAHQIQAANYGTPGYLLRSVLPGGLDEGGTTSIARAGLHSADVLSTVLPGGGVGEAAGLLGIGFLKGLRGGRAVEAAAEAAPKAAHATEEAAAVRAGLPAAKVARTKQEALYSTERGKRFAAARVHLNDQSLAPAERVAKAKAELAGELPKINFQGFGELDSQSLEALQRHILDHPTLLEGSKIRATDALTGALAGRTPTRGEIQLLQHVFGKNTAAGLESMRNSPFRDTIYNVLNVPRSLMASFDLSAPFRQGLMVATRHPTLFARNFGSMIKSFGSEHVYQGVLDDIHSRPTYPLMMEAKLPFTELGRDIGGREERFASDYAEKLTGGKWGPVRASGRAYTGFLDKTRADVFDHLLQRAQAQGINVHDQHFLESLGRYVGAATGRGGLGPLESSANALNAALFSPRLLASRLSFLNPRFYHGLHPAVRKEALRSGLQLAGTLSTLLGLASQVPGVKVATDPRNPDWGKIRLGNTRIDLAGGFQQELRLLAQLATGTAISSTTGKRLSLTAGGFGQPTRLDILQRFFEGKAAPLASLALDKLRGSTQVGQPFHWGPELASRMTPLLAQDSLDLYRERHGGLNGLAAALAGYGVGAFGVGMQTYGPRAPKARAGAPSDYFGGSSSGGSPYFSPSSSGGGGYFGP